MEIDVQFEFSVGVAPGADVMLASFGLVYFRFRPGEPIAVGIITLPVKKLLDDRQAVRKVGAEDLFHRRDAIVERQRLPIHVRQEQVAVGVHASAEVEVVAGVERQVGLGEHAELEHRHGDGLQLAPQPHFGIAGNRARRNRDRVLRDDALQPFVRSARDVAAVDVLGQRVAVRRRPC